MARAGASSSPSPMALMSRPRMILQTGTGVVGGVHSAGLAALANIAGQVHSDPLLQNNIIWHNASFGYLSDPNNPLGGLLPLAPDPYWDLQVFNGAAGQVLH